MLQKRKFKVGCTVEVSHTFESLHAHVHLDGDVAIYPGDQVLVHGSPIHPPYGQCQSERRTATVTRATVLERWWTQLVGNAECLELLDVSFSDRRIL